MTTASPTPCPKCEVYREAFDFLLEMAGVDPEDTDELDEPLKIALKINTKIDRKSRLLLECLAHFRSSHNYCGKIECDRVECSLGARISANILAEEK